MRLAIAIALCALLAAVPLTACHGKGQTITTTKTIECEPDPYDYAEEYRECTEVHRETTVVTEEPTRDRWCHGVVSCSLAMVGGLVALPFRIVGVVFDAIF